MGRKEKKICQPAVVTRINPRIELSRFCEPAFTRCFRNSDPTMTPGAPPRSMNPSVRQTTLRRAICAGTRINLTTVANIKPMLTATGAGTPRNNTRTGTVMVPAPTPVSAINIAMINPMIYCIQPPCSCLLVLFHGCGFDMNAAFNLAASPTTGARIVGILRKRRARFAADGRVAALIERQQRNR